MNQQYCSCMIILNVIAFDQHLLNEKILRNGTSCSPLHSELLKDTSGDECTLADFNDISINISKYVKYHNRS